MNNQNISILGRDAHMISSECELCCNLLCQLYDPMSAISFMRECISEPMNPGPLFIIRNTFLFLYRCFYFQLLSISKIQKYFFYCISQTKTLQLYLFVFIIALHINLVCIFPRHKRFSSVVAFPYLFSVLYTSHTLCLTTTW
jgi:hypothetical protein